MQGRGADIRIADRRLGKNMKGYVYILQNGDEGIYYIGSTNDVDRRMYQHSIGSTKTTHRMREQIVRLVQEFPSLEIARKVELRLKKFKRRDFIEKIVRDGKINLTGV